MPRRDDALRRTAWDAKTLRDPHAQPDKAARVEAMFDAIAPTYERVNTVASLGRDAVWRRRAVAAAGVQAGDVVLDVCCGTGDMVRAFARHSPAPQLVIGVDFAAQMLAQWDFGKPLLHGHGSDQRAQADACNSDHRRPSAAPVNSVPTVHVLRADALRLPLADQSVDVITCTFGVRNFRDVQVGLTEMYRAARPGARVVILEFGNPQHPLLRWAYRLYCDTVLPRLAAVISGDKTGAYRYLPRSIQTFEPARTLARRLEDVGFGDVTMQPMNLGGVVLYRGCKKGTADDTNRRVVRRHGATGRLDGM